MSSERHPPTAWRAFVLSGLGLLLGAPLVYGQPVRLRVRVDRSTVQVGQSTRITVELLDQGYRPASNDRTRSITFDLRGTGQGQTASGSISPNPVAVAAGASSVSVSFTGATAGWATIRGASDGLASGEDFVRVVDGTSSWLMQMLVPTAYAQAPLPIQILPRGQELRPISVNGRSSAHLRIMTEQPLAQGQEIRILVRTQPAVPIILADGERNLTGVAEILIKGGPLSDPFGIEVPSAGTVTVTAEMEGTGQRDTVDVNFVTPVAKGIVLLPAKEPKPIATFLDSRPFELWLKDGDGVKIEQLDKSHRIVLREATGRLGVAFESDLVELSPSQPIRHPELRWRGIPTGGELHLVARDGEQDLVSGEATLQVAIAGYALAFLAGVGGALGGLARHVYRVGTPILWPVRKGRRLDPGLMGNALFGILFGVVLYQAGELGVTFVTQAAATWALAFYFGVLGGFGGSLVLERLIDKVLPGQAQGHDAAPGAPDQSLSVHP